jgi:hypothetical protein
MPEFNIFIMMGDTPNKEEKKAKKDKKNPLAEALKKSNENEDEMVNHLSGIKDKLRRLPMTSHVGGG